MLTRSSVATDALFRIMMQTVSQTSLSVKNALMVSICCRIVHTYQYTQLISQLACLIVGKHSLRSSMILPLVSANVRLEAQILILGCGEHCISCTLAYGCQTCLGETTSGKAYTNYLATTQHPVATY